MVRKWSWLRTGRHWTVGVVVVLTLTMASGLAAADEQPMGGAPPEKPTERAKDTGEAKRVWYQLVQATIPEDSPHRKNDSLSKPPNLFVILKKNGEQIGPRSTRQDGWSAVFPRELDNQWPVREWTDDLYTIEVWDHHWHKSNVMIFNIAGIKGEAFRKVLTEPAGENIAQARLATIKFNQIETPEKYRQPNP